MRKEQRESLSKKRINIVVESKNKPLKYMN